MVAIFVWPVTGSGLQLLDAVVARYSMGNKPVVQLVRPAPLDYDEKASA